MKKILAVLFLVMFLPAVSQAEMDVYFLDVGQGDCTIILCDGESMIIDGGPALASQKVFTFIRDELELTEMRYMISTHPHEDHISGLAAVLNAVPVELILSPVTEWTTKRFENLRKYADLQDASIIVPSVGDSFPLGDATITILQCWPEAIQWRENDVNDMSIVVRIDYGETSLIVTGDAEETSEFMMIDAGLPLKADVLRIAHHGSTYSTSDEFLRTVSPTYAIISCGVNNGYYHPHGRVLNALKKNEIKLFRTDLQGTIHMISDGEKISFTTEREAAEEDLYIAPAWVQDEQPASTDDAA